MRLYYIQAPLSISRPCQDPIPKGRVVKGKVLLVRCFDSTVCRRERPNARIICLSGFPEHNHGLGYGIILPRRGRCCLLIIRGVIFELRLSTKSTFIRLGIEQFRNVFPTSFRTCHDGLFQRRCPTYPSWTGGACLRTHIRGTAQARGGGRRPPR